MARRPSVTGFCSFRRRRLFWPWFCSGWRKPSLLRRRRLALPYPFIQNWRQTMISVRRKSHRKNQNFRETDMRNLFHFVTGTVLALALAAPSAHAQKQYDPGATDTEIKIGQTVPFSGPASAYASIGKTQA